MEKNKTSFLEIFAFYTIVFSTIWLGQVISFRPPAALAAILLFGVCFYSTWKHKDSLYKIGFARSQLKQSLLLTFKVFSIPLIILSLLIFMEPLPPITRLFFGEKGIPPSLQNIPLPILLLFGLFRYPIWALAQEYALLSFMGNRWEDIFGNRPWTISILNGILFAAVHAPNPYLMSFSLLGGIAFTRIFLRARHIIPIAIFHGIVGLLLSVLLRNIPGAMMVGPTYWRYQSFQ